MKMRLGVSLIVLTGLTLLAGCYGGHGEGHYGSDHKGLSHASMYEIQTVQAGEIPGAFVLNKMTGEVQAVFCGPVNNQLNCQKTNLVGFESAALAAAHPEMEDDE